jgi:2-oxoglutarate dehydrogenase E1 component
MATGEQPLDWSAAEALALASLAVEGFRIRMTGQDTARGTFTQRHAILHEYKDGRAYMPLQHVGEKQAPVEIINSPLSEVAVAGFEYGYSLDWPDGLILWEAQFGDFVNVAQVLIDQFISSAEDKWGLLSGLVMLLPHGFEGAGPEHSSARLERFLALAAEDNIQVVYPTTPAQYFHVLRRQVVRRWRKPLIVMTPKSLLRHPAVVSSLQECAEGKFETILPNAAGEKSPPSDVSRILLCSGKVYYDLDKHRSNTGRNNVAIFRVEQLYPLRMELLDSLLSKYREGIPLVWVQEEPENMGAWHYMRVKLGEKAFGRFPFSGVHRHESASPATGSANAHKKEHDELIAAAFGH